MLPISTSRKERIKAVVRNKQRKGVFGVRPEDSRAGGLQEDKRGILELGDIQPRQAKLAREKLEEALRRLPERASLRTPPTIEDKRPQLAVVKRKDLRLQRSRGTELGHGRARQGKVDVVGGIQPGELLVLLVI
jgi:hypothetical protein